MTLINRIILLPAEDQYMVIAQNVLNTENIIAEKFVKTAQPAKSQKKHYFALRLEALNQLKDRLN